jgi:hypothetical protein
MRPDAPREEFVRRIRALSDLIERELPATVSSQIPCNWSVVSALLRARIATQGRSLATLLEARCELDARMVMRSMLDHLTLLAWLAIDPSELHGDEAGDKKWQARNPERNTRWWIADQFRREKADRGKQHALFGILDQPARAALRKQKILLKDALGWGEFPSVEDMANEVDAWWWRFEGWSRAQPGDPSFVNTIRGFYWTLYKVGNASTHPDLGVMVNTFLERVENDRSLARVQPERAVSTVDPFAGMAVFLLLHTMSVSENVCKTQGLDDALRILDRFDAVRGPDLLLAKIDEVLAGRDGRRYGRIAGQPLCVERRETSGRSFSARIRGGRVCPTRPDPSGRWTALQAPEASWLDMS